VRDGAVDLARAWCLCIVVVLHALMVGVSVGPHGPILQNALEGWAGFAPFTWLVQIMPLFFVLGGFSAYTQWTAMCERGSTPAEYVGTRMRRLLRPSVAAIGAMVVVLALLATSGVPGEIVAVAGFRLSQPLWFLGVYALTTSLVPALAAAHRRAPFSILAVLAALAVAVDVVRAATGIAVIGILNLAFVWLLVQQFGFWLAEGRMPRSQLRLAGIAVASYGLLALLCTIGVFSFDLLADLNPPCCALVVPGVGQLAVFELVRPWLGRMHATRSVGAVGTWINARAMTVYLWHMLVLVLLAGALLLLKIGLPEPLSGAWWASRPLWLACAVTAVALVAWFAARWEIRRPPATNGPRGSGRVAASLSTVFAVVGITTILLSGFTIAGGVVGLVCLVTGLAAVQPSFRSSLGISSSSTSTVFSQPVTASVGTPMASTG
jgi:hypothetical protein